MADSPSTTNDDLRKLVDELRATVDLKDHLLQMVSHEMRTPLVSITNFSSAILSSWDVVSDDAKREYLGIINQQATRLSRLVGDLLAVARLESGRLRTHSEPVSISELARETVLELRPEDPVEVICHESLVVRADRDHVKQMLVNFLTNAIKYGASPITIAGEEREDGTAFWVADHGAGLDPEFEPHLFEKFSQGGIADHTTGTGLGMAIVQGLAHAQHGTAWYARHDGEVRFGVTLPSAA